METDSYPERFLQADAARSYNECEYAASSYSSIIWRMQRPLLRTWLRQCLAEHPEPRHLDFACGTGRITQMAEEVFGEVDGLDISQEMVSLARQRCPESRFFVGDVLNEPDLCPGPYTSISTFRLILNLDPPLRLPILRQIHSRLGSGGKLILNVHGSSHSLRQPAIIWKRWRHPVGQRDGLMLNSMSPGEITTCLEAVGFSVEERKGFGVLPPTLYRWPLRGFWIALDRFLSRVGFLQPFCVDLMYRASRRAGAS